MGRTNSASILFTVCCLLFTVYCLPSTVYCLPTPAFAEEVVTISADSLEYIAETDTYIAKGSVLITYTDSTLKADEVQLNNITKDAVCIGNVIYEDKEAIIRADKIELNLDTKLGVIYNGNILFKSQNYHITGEKIKRLGEDTYHLDKASITTCDACPPEWSFTGRDVSIKLGDRIKARDVAFHIKGVPVLYSPYFWTPITRERQTGFLFPVLGHSTTKGFRIKQGFFWAIADNRDLTLYLDYYSKRGIGQALHYRYLESPKTDGDLFVFHIRDSQLNKNFLKVKALHNQELPYDASGYLNLQMVNERDFYREYGLTLEERLGKYLESNLHVSRPFSGGRVYFLSQYRQSLEGSSEEIPQSLPELGFVLNTTRLGPGSFNFNITGNNFWREEGQRGQRLDINPNFYMNFGRTITFSQRIGLRGTLYALNEPDASPSRSLFESQSILSTKLSKRYTPFLHIIEPSIEYSYILPSVDPEYLPGFDSKDFISKTSLVSYSLTNRFAGNEREALIRFSNGYNLLDVARPFTPILAEAALLSRNLQLKINTTYDIYEKTITETTASATLRSEKSFISVGKAYRNSIPMNLYSLEAGLDSRILNLYSRLWYDVKGEELRELNIKATYKSQCWAVGVSFTRRPQDYQFLISIELKGIGSIQNINRWF